MASEKLIDFMHKQRPMYEIGNVAAKAIEFLLDHEEDMRNSVSRINAGKKYFQDAMQELGLSTYATWQFCAYWIWKICERNSCQTRSASLLQKRLSGKKFAWLQ